ncbi:MAG: NAD(P)/FAD-dependent oxidoreductase [Verrucomicrobiota bacterium]
MNEKYDLVVIGGGAAGVFAAIRLAERDSSKRIVLLEAGAKLLQKVKVSGGGRCNVTHHQFEPALLVERYPRGRKELRGPFTRFQPRDMVSWLEARGVETKVESDGRIFPVSNSSQTIIDCFMQRLQHFGISIQYQQLVKRVLKLEGDLYRVETKSGAQYVTDHVLIATGSHRSGYQIAEELGHTIVPPVPSLFTFKVDDPRIVDLPGISSQDVGLKLKCDDRTFQERGPLLITHWGLSGPAILRLSAFAARELFACHYDAELRIDWCPDSKGEQFETDFLNHARIHSRKKLANAPFGAVPKRYWASLLDHLEISREMSWDHLSKKSAHRLKEELKNGLFQVQGKGVFKDEFVTAGGVETKELKFKTYESKQCPGIYFAGEVLNLDGVTGGFNFQSAWTAAELVACDLS